MSKDVAARDEPPLTCEEARALTAKKIPGARLFRSLGLAHEFMQVVWLVIFVAFFVIEAITRLLQ